MEDKPPWWFGTAWLRVIMSFREKVKCSLFRSRIWSDAFQALPLLFIPNFVVVSHWVEILVWLLMTFLWVAPEPVLGWCLICELSDQLHCRNTNKSWFDLLFHTLICRNWFSVINMHYNWFYDRNAVDQTTHKQDINPKQVQVLLTGMSSVAKPEIQPNGKPQQSLV